MKRHAEVQREAMDDIRDLEKSPDSPHNTVKYMEPNRDRVVGDADRTGRHFDNVVEPPDEGEAD